jgi:adenylosuccinate synthase
MMMNRLREVARGDDRHGSCGLGIGEARHYWLRYGHDAIFAADLGDGNVLRSKLNLMRDRFLIEMQELARIDPESAEILRSHFPGAEASDLRRDSERLKINSTMPHAETVIFEGSQGVLLDEWKGFHPYTTWSTVTPQHAFEMLDELTTSDVEVETSVIGLTRAYSTRHGAGPFPTFCPQMTSEMLDRGNPKNDWQGEIRFGPLDLVLLEYGARVCNIDSVFVSCLDELPKSPRMVLSYQNGERLDEPMSLNEQEQLTKTLELAEPLESVVTEEALLERIDQIAPICGLSRGPAAGDREWFSHRSVGEAKAWA